VTNGSVRVFPVDDIRAALETILASFPAFLVLDHEFIYSQRGAAMIDRLHADPGFGSTQVLVVNGATVSPLTVGEDTSQGDDLDWRGTRRVPRIRMKPGIEVQVDGSPAQLVDLSTLGAQVVSGAALKPNQRVRFSLPSDASARLVATVAWANFELPKGKPLPQYRAGLEFANPDSRVLEHFCVTYASGDPDPHL
jgi:hypothetical protein